MEIVILLLGDVVGKPGRAILKERLRPFKEAHGVDFVIANGENAAQGSGITPKLCEEIQRAGVDVVTLGDHTWKRREVIPLLEGKDTVLRPVNYPRECPGRGSGVFTSPSGNRIGLVTLVGRVFMAPTDCPFHAVEEEVARLRRETPVLFVEMHAEATSEKMAIAWQLDGQVTCVYGTHTHVPTADGRILPGGTAYITDLGMTGPYGSVIGRDKESVLFKFRTQMHSPFTVATEDVRMCGAMVRVEVGSGRARSIERVELTQDETFGPGPA